MWKRCSRRLRNSGRKLRRPIGILRTAHQGILQCKLLQLFSVWYDTIDCRVEIVVEPIDFICESVVEPIDFICESVVEPIHLLCESVVEPIDPVAEPIELLCEIVVDAIDLGVCDVDERHVVHLVIHAP
jgi:hypothetical protein